MEQEHQEVNDLVVQLEQPPPDAPGEALVDHAPRRGPVHRVDRAHRGFRRLSGHLDRSVLL